MSSVTVTNVQPKSPYTIVFLLDTQSLNDKLTFNSLTKVDTCIRTIQPSQARSNNKKENTEKQGVSGIQFRLLERSSSGPSPAPVAEDGGHLTRNNST